MSDDERTLSTGDFFIRADGDETTLKDLARSDPDAAQDAWQVLTSALREGAAALESPPVIIDHYRVVRELGRGGMGVVYEARDEQLGRSVALKVMSHSGAADSEATERFHREAATASRLDDPGICKVYGSGHSRGLPYIAMQLVEGETVLQRNKSTPPPSTREDIQEVARILEETARALHTAHVDGVIHRDIKPGNIMVTPEGRSVILDFGLARADDADLPTLTQEGDLFGTPAYMAPERLKEHAPVDSRSDIYALGVVLYEMLTHRRPFVAATREALFGMILNRDPAAAHTVNDVVPKDLAVIAQVAMEKSPDRRYSTAAALAEDLARFRRREPITARPPSLLGRMQRWAGRHPTAALLSSLVLLLALAASVLGGMVLAELPRKQQAEEVRRLEKLETRLERAYLAYNERRYGDAERLFGELVTEPSVQTEANLGLALVLRKERRMTELLDLLSSLPAAIRDTTPFQLLQIDALRKTGKKEEATRILENAKPARTALGHFLIGITLLHAQREGALERARKALDRAALLAPRARALYHQQRAFAALMAGDREMILQCEVELRSLWPDSPETWIYSAFINGGAPMSRPRTSGGLMHAQLDETNPMVQPRFDRALEAYQRALDIDPSSISALVNMGVVLQKLGRTDDAMKQFELAVERLPDHVLPRFNLGLARQRAGDPDGAMEVWREALEYEQEHVLTLRALAISLRNQGEHEEARALLDRALKSDPTDPQTLTWSGVFYMDTGDTEAAEQAWRTAIKHAPTRTLPRQNLSRLLSETGRFEEAAELFVSLLKDSGYGNVAVAMAAARCLLRSDQQEAALEVLEKTHEKVKDNAAIPQQNRDDLRESLERLRQRGG